MKSFLVGLLVIMITAVLSVIGILLFPFLLILGFFLRWIVGIFLILFTIWLVGKMTLLLIDALRKKEKN